MIPVLLCPILNRADLLIQMMASIDHPIEQTIVIDNGGVVAPDIEAIRLPHNVGVAGSWNLGLMVTPFADWWLIVNSDITFSPGDLAKIEATVDPAVAGIWQAVGYSAFAITAMAVARIGLFDTGFVNGYFEDDDYSRRAAIAGVPIATVETGITHVGSATIYSDAFYMDQNHKSFRANDDYYRHKWGGGTHGGERFETPFDAGGDVRDIRTDFTRFRSLSWRRR